MSSTLWIASRFHGYSCESGIAIFGWRSLKVTLTIPLIKNIPEAELKKFKPWLKYGWFHSKLYSIFQDLSRRSIETGFWGI